MSSPRISVSPLSSQPLHPPSSQPNLFSLSVHELKSFSDECIFNAQYFGNTFRVGQVVHIMLKTTQWIPEPPPLHAAGTEQYNEQLQRDNYHQYILKNSLVVRVSSIKSNTKFQASLLKNIVDLHESFVQHLSNNNSSNTSNTSSTTSNIHHSKYMEENTPSSNNVNTTNNNTSTANNFCDQVYIKPLASDMFSFFELEFVELSFKDQFISRSDMWRFTLHLQEQTVYIGKTFKWQGMKAQVKEIMIKNNIHIKTGIISQNTKFTFRSKSANIYLLFQMSREMWQYDYQRQQPFQQSSQQQSANQPNSKLKSHYFAGQSDSNNLFFEKAIHGFMREIFDKWHRTGAHHSLTIILFSRHFVEDSHCNNLDFLHPMQQLWNVSFMSYKDSQQKKKKYIDFYKVINLDDIALLLNDNVVTSSESVSSPNIINSPTTTTTTNSLLGSPSFVTSPHVSFPGNSFYATSATTSSINMNPNVTNIVAWNIVLIRLKREFLSYQESIAQYWKELCQQVANVLETNHKEAVELNNSSISNNISFPISEEKFPYLINSTSEDGNFLEATNLVLHRYDNHHISRDLYHTGQLIIFVTAGSGVFNIRHSIMSSITKKRLMDNGIALDMISLGAPALHAVPIFRYFKNAPQTSSVHFAPPLPNQVTHSNSVQLSSSSTNTMSNSIQQWNALSSPQRTANRSSATVHSQQQQQEMLTQYTSPKSTQVWYRSPDWLYMSFYNINSTSTTIQNGNVIYSSLEDVFYMKSSRYTPTARLPSIQQHTFLTFEEYVKKDSDQFMIQFIQDRYGPHKFLKLINFNSIIAQNEQSEKEVDELSSSVDTVANNFITLAKRSYGLGEDGESLPDGLSLQDLAIDFEKYDENVFTDAKQASPLISVQSSLHKKKPQSEKKQAKPLNSNVSTHQLESMKRSTSVHFAEVRDEMQYYGHRSMYRLQSDVDLYQQSISDVSNITSSATASGQPIKRSRSAISDINSLAASPLEKRDEEERFISVSPSKRRDSLAPPPAPPNPKKPISINSYSSDINSLLFNPFNIEESSVENMIVNEEEMYFQFAASSNKAKTEYYRRWSHLYPNKYFTIKKSHFDDSSLVYLKPNWLSLVEPACLPLTNAFWPDQTKLNSQYSTYTWDVTPNNDEYETMDIDMLLRELICQRLHQGFQLHLPNHTSTSSITASSTTPTSATAPNSNISTSTNVSNGEVNTTTPTISTSILGLAAGMNVKDFILRGKPNVFSINYTLGGDLLGSTRSRGRGRGRGGMKRASVTSSNHSEVDTTVSESNLDTKSTEVASSTVILEEKPKKSALRKKPSSMDNSKSSSTIRTFLLSTSNQYHLITFDLGMKSVVTNRNNVSSTANNTSNSSESIEGGNTIRSITVTRYVPKSELDAKRAMQEQAAKDAIEARKLKMINTLSDMALDTKEDINSEIVKKNSAASTNSNSQLFSNSSTFSSGNSTSAAVGRENANLAVIKTVKYNYVLWNISTEGFESKSTVFKTEGASEYNWNFLDHLICGFNDQLSSTLKYRCIRFNLVPIVPNCSIVAQSYFGPSSLTFLGATVGSVGGLSRHSSVAQGLFFKNSQEEKSVSQMEMEKRSQNFQKIKETMLSKTLFKLDRNQEFKLEILDPSVNIIEYNSQESSEYKSVRLVCLKGFSEEDDSNTAPNTADGNSVNTTNNSNNSSSTNATGASNTSNEQTSDRCEWIHLKYKPQYHALQSYSIEIDWLACNGCIVADFVQKVARRARQCGFNLIQTPINNIQGMIPDPFMVNIELALPNQNAVFIALEKLCQHPFNFLPENIPIKSSNRLIHESGAILLEFHPLKNCISWIENPFTNHHSLSQQFASDAIIQRNLAAIKELFKKVQALCTELSKAS